MKKVLFGIIGLLVLLFAGAVIYWFTMDANALKAQLTKYASQKLGRELVIAGDLSPSFSITDGFGITVKGVSLANAQGFSPATMFSLNELQLVINPFALLHHQVQVRKLVVDKADVWLEARGSRNNWSFADKAAEDTTVAPPAGKEEAPPMQVGIDKVEGSDLTVTMVSDGQKKVYKIESLDLEAALDEPVTLDVKAEADGQPVTLALTAGTLAAIEGGEKQKIDFTLAMPPHDVTVKGDYRRAGETHHLTNAQIDYNGIVATGSVAAKLGGTPDVTLDIVVPQLDIAKLQSDGGDAKAADYSSAEGGPVFSRDPLPWDALNGVNVNAKVAITQLLNDGKKMGPADMQARLLNGNLGASVITQPPGARQPISVKVSASAAKQASVTVAAPSLEPTLLLGDNPLLQAPASVSVALAGAGNSLHDIAASANGHATVAFEPGTLNASALPLAAKGALASVVGLDQIDGARMACTKLDFVVAGGTATARGIGIDSAPLLAAGEGAVNLGTEQVNLRLVAEPQVAVAKGARFPIYIKGALASPTTMVDTAAITGQIANAAAGKAIKLLNDDKLAGIADVLVGKSKTAANTDYARMPFNPCRPTVPAETAAPAPAAQPATTPPTTQPQPKEQLQNLLKGFLGQ